MSGVPRPVGAKVIVVGAGIAGLTAAFRLRQAGAAVTVLERANRVGGRMMTVRRDGYLIDAAASVLPSSYRKTTRLIADAGLAGCVRPTSDLLGIARPDRVHRLRSGRRTDLLTTALLGVRSKYALAKVLRDLYRHRAALADPRAPTIGAVDTESVEEYARRVLTREALDYFVQPLVGDFYLTGPDKLSVVNLFLLLATMVGTGFVNSADGVRFLPEGLARQLPVELSTNVTTVTRTGREVTVGCERPGTGERVLRADAAVVAVPAVHASRLVPQLDETARDLLVSVPYARSMVVTLALARPPAEPAMWLTVPDRTHPDVNVVILDHRKAPGRVPAGAGLVTVYWHREWATRHWELDDERVLGQAMAGLRQVLPDVDGQLRAGYVWRWDPCTVARPPGGFRALAELSRRLDPDAPIQFAGDYFGITTVESSIASGERAAARVLGALTRTRR